ncbi:MAG: FecR domain-containing protein [Methylotenera sp.]|uniref:FecR domain-containing protein n=1 Tax=Methylotenera sp. TaxID=2051956 RepID=UPI002730DF8B|nr:FecR domain-containing protein [Methylotenera sp.]MDP1521888.1 FecR domain-containing protein [Methylotenera sp.]
MKFATYCIGVLLLAMSFSSFANVTRPENVNQEAIWLYTVNQDDSFEIIYKKYLNKRANIAELAKYNQHKLTKKLQPGQVISIPVEMLKKIPTSAQVLLVYGDVQVASAPAIEKRKVQKGDFLTQGDTLETGKNSLAKLLFADGSNMDIQPNSNLSIQASYKYVGKETYVTHLKLVKGRTEVTANPEHVAGNTLQVETPSAVAAVRGTQFRVGAEGDIALQETLDGRVAFSAVENGVVQEILIAKGYGSVAEKGKAPSPPILLPDAPDVSALPKLIEQNIANFSLPQPQGVAVLVSQLALDVEFTQILNEQVTQSGKLSFADLTDGQYYLKIRAQDQHGLQGIDAIHAFNVMVRLPEPAEPVLELIEPADGAIIPLAPTVLSWTPISAANSYVVQIARDTHFVDIVFERRVSFDKLTINQSFGAGEFYWRVAVLSDGKPQRFSEVRKFSR